jgi:hypothetical protein
MKKNFIFVYEDPEYIDQMEEFEAMAEMPQEPMPTDEDLERMAHFYQQRMKERG